MVRYRKCTAVSITLFAVAGALVFAWYKTGIATKFQRTIERRAAWAACTAAAVPSDRVVFQQDRFWSQSYDVQREWLVRDWFKIVGAGSRPRIPLAHLFCGELPDHEGNTRLVSVVLWRMTNDSEQDALYVVADTVSCHGITKQFEFHGHAELRISQVLPRYGQNKRGIKLFAGQVNTTIPNEIVFCAGTGDRESIDVLRVRVDASGKIDMELIGLDAK